MSESSNVPQATGDTAFNATTANPNQLAAYVESALIQYERDGTTDNDLWLNFAEDFESFTVDSFSQLSRTHRSLLQRLRNFLRYGGVYVAMNTKRITIAQALMACLEEEEKHTWTEEDIHETVEDNSDAIRSPRLRNMISNLKSGKPLSGFTPSEANKSSSPTSQSQLETEVADRTHPHVNTTSLFPEATPHANMPSGPTIPSLSSLSSGPSTVPMAAENPSPGRTKPPATTSPSPAASTYGKELANMAKMYNEEQKYSGTGGGETLVQELNIFYNTCWRVGIQPDGYSFAFPTMLKGMALDFYFNNNLAHLPFDSACNQVREFFEGPVFEQQNLAEWNSLSLKGIILTNQEKSTSECLRLLLNKLSGLQHGLMPTLRGIDFLHNKVVTACQGVPACRYGVSDPPRQLGPLINKLQSSITAYEKENPTPTSSSQFFTDRRYYRHKDTNTNNRRCFVCGKEGCRSWKHPDKEKNNARAKLGKVRQYLADIDDDDEEEQPPEEESPLDRIFHAITMDDHAQEEDKDSTAFFVRTTNLLSNQACRHAVDPHNTPSEKNPISPFTYKEVETTAPNYHYGASDFMGVVIDTGASKRSTAGYRQYKALASNTNLPLDTSKQGMVYVQFGIGATSSIGSITVSTPIGEVEFHVVNVDTPFLLCLADMDRLGVYYNNVKDLLVGPNISLRVVRRFGHAFLLWDTHLHLYIQDSLAYDPCYLTSTELRQLHRRFGHPSVDRFYRVLQRAGHDAVSREELGKISRVCEYCQKYGRSPGRFRFQLKDDIDFNYSIVVDIMYIDGQPLLHIVDEATRFQNGRWLQNLTSKHTWEVLRLCWIDTYLGPPDLITHDAGKNFVSKEFQQYAANVGSATKGVPVEAHNSIGMVERYHEPVRRIFRIVTLEIPGIERDMALQMTFKAINDTAGPDGLVPTLLVFGAYPRLTESDAPSPTLTQRAQALRKAMDEVRRIRAERHVRDTLRFRNGPRTTAVQELPLNSSVLVWREGPPGHWSGPHSLLAQDGETCTVDINGPTKLRSTVVKPYYHENSDDTTPVPPTTDPPPPITETTEQAPLSGFHPMETRYRGRGRPRLHPDSV